VEPWAGAAGVALSEQLMAMASDLFRGIGYQTKDNDPNAWRTSERMVNVRTRPYLLSRTTRYPRLLTWGFSSPPCVPPRGRL